MRQREIFVLGLDDFQQQLLEELPQASECNFHGLGPVPKRQLGLPDSTLGRKLR